MSLIFATQLTAVATVALAVLAIAAAIVAGIALSKQSRQLAILAGQDDRDIAERRQAQAAQVFTGVEDVRPRYAHPYAMNGSGFPVYDAQFWQTGPGGLSDPDGHRHDPAGRPRHRQQVDPLSRRPREYRPHIPGRSRRTLDTHAGRHPQGAEARDRARQHPCRPRQDRYPCQQIPPPRPRKPGSLKNPEHPERRDTTIPAMTERKHNLPAGYDRLEDQITGDVLDSIVIHPRSHGRLHMPGEWSTDNRPATRARSSAAARDPDNQGVYTEESLLGSAERYLVTYDVWNYRDSPSFARIVLTGPETPDTQEE